MIDEQPTQTVRLSIPLMPLAAVVAAKVLDTTSTLIALSRGDTFEGRPVTALIIEELGRLEGALFVTVVAIATVIMLAVLAGRSVGTALAWLEWPTEPTPLVVRGVVYGFSTLWFAMLAARNLGLALGAVL